MTDESAPPGVDPTVPNAARVYDYLLGGKDNFKADRELGDLVMQVLPETRDHIRMYRSMVGRFVQYLVGQGIRQFLDLGSGLPSHQNVHEVAHRLAPDARVVYVDNDPVVCAHGRALLEEPERVAMVQADARDPAAVLADPQVRGLLDFDRPVALLMLFFLHMIPDADDPHAFTAAYRDALAPGSYLVISHVAGDTLPERTDRIVELYRHAGTSMNPRSEAEVRRFFGDFELTPPGLVNGVVTVWPFGDETDTPFWDPDLAKMIYSGIGFKK
ncbi:SAM-dependent methyltransferase [Thermoactinospora rubra]|uniref:SAM-dependent methyltransferase n=1 Tax=Thermoactinospora rubra TaxID=1088767 RepID=UPI000A0F8EA2|nr:SAM-dependent methyltransferase [Thermoactinospora rubra]